MKILFRYNKSKKICSNAQEAIEFIESQKTMSNEWLGETYSYRNLCVNEGCIRLLERMFDSEWGYEGDGLPIIDTSTRGRVYIKRVDYTHIFGLYRSGDYIKPEWFSDQRVYIYKPLADTLEEHEEIYKTYPKEKYSVYGRLVARRRKRNTNL